VPSVPEPDLTLFLDILRKLEKLEVHYVIIGGFAATMYGITRATYDIDIIVKMEESHIYALSAAYPLPRFYADPHQMITAIQNGNSFNIIDTERGEKADLFPLTMDPRFQPAFDNRMRRRVDLVGIESFSVWAARPEDVIIGKLMAWHEGKSERHTADIFEMVLFNYLGGYEGFDEAYIAEQAAKLGSEVAAQWKEIRHSAQDAASQDGNLSPI
jgi:hypothetical protein